VSGLRNRILAVLAAAAVQMVNNKVALWQGYGASLNDLVANSAKIKAKLLGESSPVR
jgi:hypothetical protein